MSKQVIIELTVPQAITLRTMIASSDAWNAEELLTALQVRATRVFEDAVERGMGAEFKYRLTPRDTRR